MSAPRERGPETTVGAEAVHDGRRVALFARDPGDEPGVLLRPDRPFHWDDLVRRPLELDLGINPLRAAGEDDARPARLQFRREHRAPAQVPQPDGGRNVATEHGVHCFTQALSA